MESTVHTRVSVHTQEELVAGCGRGTEAPVGHYLSCIALLTPCVSHTHRDTPPPPLCYFTLVSTAPPTGATAPPRGVFSCPRTHTATYSQSLRAKFPVSWTRWRTWSAQVVAGWWWRWCWRWGGGCLLAFSIAESTERRDERVFRTVQIGTGLLAFTHQSAQYPGKAQFSGL